MIVGCYLFLVVKVNLWDLIVVLVIFIRRVIFFCFYKGLVYLFRFFFIVEKRRKIEKVREEKVDVEEEVVEVGEGEVEVEEEEE